MYINLIKTKFHAEKYVLGFLLAAYSFAALIAAPIFGRLVILLHEFCFVTNHAIRHITITNCPFRFAFSHLPKCGQLL